VDIVSLLPLLLLGVVFYFLVIRPSKVRQRTQAALIASVAPGAQIMTTAGIYGKVVSNDEEFVRLEIAPGTVITMLPAGIAKIVEPGPAPDDIIE
jgi:preprotein translocase subunit YajC